MNWNLFVTELVAGITHGSVYALIALGYSMVYGILKLLNFAHGDIYMVGAFIGWALDKWLGISPWGMIVFLLLGFAAGVINVMRAAGVSSGPGQQPK